MKYKEYDRILLQDGRKGIILSVLEEDKAYEVEIEDLKDINYAHECPAEIVKYEDIQKVIG